METNLFDEPCDQCQDAPCPNSFDLVHGITGESTEASSYPRSEPCRRADLGWREPGEPSSYDSTRLRPVTSWLTSLLARGRSAKKSGLPREKGSGCSANFLNRLQKFQQVGVDFILVRGRETVRPARIVNFFRSLDEPGRFLC